MSKSISLTKDPKFAEALKRVNEYMAKELEELENDNENL